VREAAEGGGMNRHNNNGLRKVCACPRRTWAKCRHPWHFNFKLPGVPGYRFSVDAEAGKHIESKGEAEALADGWRTAIRAGTFRRRAEQPVSSPTTPDATTLRAFGSAFIERSGRGTANNKACLSRLVSFRLKGTAGSATLGDLPLSAITEDAIEMFFAQLRAEGRAASTVNKYVHLTKAMFRWAARKKYLPMNILADSDTIKRAKMAQRNRRLAPDHVSPKTGALLRAGEERALLAVAGPHLQRLVIGALETGCRLGELLRLRWSDVDLKGRVLTVRAETTKTRTARAVPVSARLAAVLEMARASLIAALPETPDERERHARVAVAFVFGDVVGQRVSSVRKAWDTAVLKAHGHSPVWVGGNALSPECRSKLRTIDLHFHDLRHEAGSRFVEAGWPIHHVRDLLGHASLEQTTTYLNVTQTGLQESMARFDALRCNPVANEATVERTPDRNDDTGIAHKHHVN
jgi:integrase